jgi:hypothetical protein
MAWNCPFRSLLAYIVRALQAEYLGPLSGPGTTATQSEAD